MHLHIYMCQISSMQLLIFTVREPYIYNDINSSIQQIRASPFI